MVAVIPGKNPELEENPNEIHVNYQNTEQTEVSRNSVICRETIVLERESEAPVRGHFKSQVFLFVIFFVVSLLFISLFSRSSIVSTFHFIKIGGQKIFRRNVI